MILKLFKINLLKAHAIDEKLKSIILNEDDIAK
jgi:hypothetical protein